MLRPQIIEKKKKKKKPKKPPDVVEGQTSLTSGAVIPEMRRQRETMWMLIAELKDKYFEFRLRQAVLVDVVLINQGRMNVRLTACMLQRYGDSRLSIRDWWLNFMEGFKPNDPEQNEAILEGWWVIFNDAPMWDDYDWVSYWQDPDDIDEIIRFIKDRAKWAIPHCRKDLLGAYDAFRNSKQKIRNIAKRLKEAKIELKEKVRE